jgi:nondiscriminating glutamyl-tRNA synthetase
LLFIDIVRSNCVFPDEADRWARALFTDELSLNADLEELARQAGPEYFLAGLDAASEAGGDFQTFIGLLKSKSGAKGKALFMPLRAVLSGRLDGPEIGKLYQALTAERVKKRLAEFAGELG